MYRNPLHYARKMPPSRHSTWPQRSQYDRGYREQKGFGLSRVELG